MAAGTRFAGNDAKFDVFLKCYHLQCCNSACEKGAQRQHALLLVAAAKSNDNSPNVFIISAAISACEK